MSAATETIDKLAALLTKDGNSHVFVITSLLSILETRGYHYSTYYVPSTTIVNQIIYDGPILIMERNENATETQCQTTARDTFIHVFPVFHQLGINTNVGINTVRAIINAVSSPMPIPVTHIMIVHGSNGLTSAAATEMMKLLSNNPATALISSGLKRIYFETFSYKQLQFNPIMWPYEVVAVPGSEDTSRNFMLWTDAQRKFHDWPPGTVVSRSRQRGSLCEDQSIRIVKDP